MNNIPPLNSLKAFAVCIRHCTFTSAAEELCISQSAVSRHIKVLEDWFGVIFFLRSTNGYSLTYRGKVLAAEVQSIFEKLHCLENVIDGRSSRFRLNVPPVFASRWLIPRLNKNTFTVEGNRLDLEVKTCMQIDQLSFSDAAIICSTTLPNIKSSFPEFVIGCTLPEYLTPMMSSSFLSEHRNLLEPVELLDHTLLHTSADNDYWLQWFGSLGKEKKSQNELFFDLTETAIQAAIHNAGVALLNPEFVKEELQTEQLVAPFSDIPTTVNSYLYVYSSKKLSDPAVAAFRDWLITKNGFIATACTKGSVANFGSGLKS